MENSLQKNSSPASSIQQKTAKNPAKSNKKLFIVILFFTILIVGLSTVLVVMVLGPLIRNRFLNPVTGAEGEFKQFASEEEFITYINRYKYSQANYFSSTGFGAGPTDSLIQEIQGPITKRGTEETAISDTRYSQTNVQVEGIDEPDIVKNNGKNIYISELQPIFYPLDANPATREPNLVQPNESDVLQMEKSLIDPGFDYPQALARVINAVPVSDLSITASINETGNMLLADDILIFLGSQKISAFDVSNAKNPQKVWSYEYSKNVDNSNYTSLMEARLYNNELYLVTQTAINYSNPCEIPIMQGASDVIVFCKDIYFPPLINFTDVIYTVSKFNPANGKLLDRTSFIGTSNTNVFYMSENNLYMTYYYQQSSYKLFSGMILDSPLIFPSNITARILELDSYDLSDEAKLIELTKKLEAWYLTLSPDEYANINARIASLLQEYYKNHRKELETTIITRIDNDSLKIEEQGSVPGSLLNQFSLDEFEGNLRVAVTLGNFWGTTENSSNEVYVLNNNLDVIGDVTDLGTGERIYAVRFLNEVAYLVTFRQTDPFYILDLSNPRSPKVTGELKIPGYSSYLHPLTSNLILGVGMENGYLKLSLFDVSNKSNPQELDKFRMDEYSSELLYNHRAFLFDPEKKIFFIPGYNAGYVFSYDNNKLTLVKKSPGYNVQRAVYINDNLYLISADQIEVLSMDKWTTVAKLSL